MSANTSDASVVKALNARFMAWTGDTNLPEKTVLENDTFDPETATVDMFYRVNTIFARRPTLIGAFSDGGYYRVNGEYRVIVAVRKGTGSIVGSEKADSIKDHFTRGLVLTDANISVKIESTYRMTGVPSGSFFHLPVSIEFWAFQTYQP